MLSDLKHLVSHLFKRKHTYKSSQVHAVKTMYRIGRKHVTQTENNNRRENLGKLSAKINYKWGKCLQIHNKFMYESPYECKHNKLQLAKIQKYKITLQSSNFDVLYLNNNRPIKNQTKT